VPASRRKTLKTERRLTQLTAIANARQWAEELITGHVADTNELADREGCSERHVRQALSLAFLAPDIVQAAIDGELPPDLVMTRIRSDLPLSWSEQRKALALN
jgi:ParB-like chromosome segregation protein Spo0J